MGARVFSRIREHLYDVESVDEGLWGRDSLDSMGGIESAPSLDEPTQGVVRSRFGVGDSLLGDGARGVLACVYPCLDAVAVVGDPGGDGDGITHQL